MDGGRLLLAFGALVVCGCNGSQGPAGSAGAGGSGGAGTTGTGGVTGAAGAGGVAGTTGTGGAATGGRGGITGSGGIGGAAGAAGRGGTTGTGGSAGSMANCPALPARCPANVVQGDVRVSATDPASNYVGVTEINGRLTVPTTQDVPSFTCLEVVNGNLEIGGLSGLRGSLTNAFPNLRSTGLVDIAGFSDTVTIDACAFRSLVRAGRYFQSIGELSGQLDLSPLREFAHIRIRNSLLRRLTLPSNGTFSIGQLQIAGNTMLTTVAGFENVTLIAPAPNGFFSLDITYNPMLPSCRAEQLHQMFLAAGYVADQLFVSDNGPPCP